MRTSFTNFAILSITLGTLGLSANSNAKISNDQVNTTSSSLPEINLEREINNNILDMLFSLHGEVSRSPIDKQILEQALELQTDELVRDTDQQLPKFKFKVIIAD